MSNEIRVTVENFARAETDRMFADLARSAGGSNRWRHNREPSRLDEQTVIRQNRDTLYSFLVADISGGGTVTVPDAEGRYLSVMIVNEDHYINRVIHSAGDYQLTVRKCETPWVLVAARILVDPSDPADVSAVNALQDQLGFVSGHGAEFEAPAYDAGSLRDVRGALLELSRHTNGFARAFGRRGQVDPVKHLIGTAAGWGGLPDDEAAYHSVEPRLPVGDYELTVGEVPVDAFWSITVYNEDGYLEPNPAGICSVNSVSAVAGDDGSVTVRFGPGEQPNTIPIMDGWNYTVRMYRPRPQISDGSWTFPALELP
jgi:hypothetical protein